MKTETKSFFLTVGFFLGSGLAIASSTRAEDNSETNWELAGTEQAREEARGYEWNLKKTQNFLEYNPSIYPQGYHEGTDFSCNLGEEIRTIREGNVVFAGETSTGIGNTVIIDSGGTLTRYAHLSKILVEQGMTIGQNQVVGNCGGLAGPKHLIGYQDPNWALAKDGVSSGTHLHLECRSNGLAVDCQDYETQINNYREKAIQACWQWRTSEIDCHTLYEEAKSLNIDYFEGLAVMNFHAVAEAEKLGMYSITDRKAEFVGKSKNEILRDRKALLRLYFQNLTGATIAKSSVTLLNHSAQQNEYMNYAYEISGGDKMFLYTLKGECGEISPDCEGDWQWVNNVLIPMGRGFCQFDIRHHTIMWDERFKDWKWQMDSCWDYYNQKINIEHSRTTYYAWTKLIDYPNIKWSNDIKNFFIFN